VFALLAATACFTAFRAGRRQIASY
jgi:hypothetical protein